MKLRTPEQLETALNYEHVLQYFAEGPSILQHYELGSLAVCYSVVTLPESSRPFPMSATCASGNEITGGRSIAIISDDTPGEIHGPWALSALLSSQLRHIRAENPNYMTEETVLRQLIRQGWRLWPKYSEARAVLLDNTANFLSAAGCQPEKLQDYKDAARFHKTHLKNLHSI